jgi:hypothetical protein
MNNALTAIIIAIGGSGDPGGGDSGGDDDGGSD